MGFSDPGATPRGGARRTMAAGFSPRAARVSASTVAQRTRRIFGLAVLGSSAAAAAAALWLAPASLHIIGWQGESARVVALLAPWRDLALALTAAMIVATAVVSVSRRFGGASFAVIASTAAPLSLLWSWVVPYLPGLTPRFPILSMLAGPLRWVIAAAAMAGLVLPLVARVSWHRIPRLDRRAVFVVSLVVLSALGFTVTRSQALTGDEPHYLVVTHSLVADGDLRIENNHQQEDYTSFFPGELRPHFLRRGHDGVIYSIHAPGLPALLAPAYALAGYPGAVALMVLLTSMASLALFDLMRRFAGQTVSLVSWVLLTFSVPLLPLAWMIYPEVPALLVVAWAARWIADPPSEASVARLWVWVGRGAALAVLPWLHTKFAVLLGCLTLALIVRLWPARRALLTLLAPIAASIAAWMFTSYVMYGDPNPTIAYGGGAGLELGNVPRGLLGLLFDQEFGLLIFTPLYVLAPIGLWHALRLPEPRPVALWYAGIAAVFLVAVTQVYMWWGGSSPPARFLLPVVPLVAPLIAIAIDRLRGPTGRALIGVTAVWSVMAVIAGLLSDRRSLLPENRDGTSRLVEAVAGGAPLGNALASFFEADWMTSAGALVPWLAAATGGLLLARLVARRPSAAGGAFWGGSVGIVGTIIIGSVLGNPLIPDAARAKIANAGRTRLLMAYEGDRLWGLSYVPIARLHDSAVVAESWLTSPADARRDLDDGHVLFGPFDLPAGTYTMHVVYREPGVTARWSVAYYLRRMRGILARGSDTNADTAVSFTLPVGLPAVWARFPGSDAIRYVDEIRVVPADVVPRRDRIDARDGIRQIWAVDETSGAYVFFVDDNTDPRGDHFWVRHRATGTILVTAPGDLVPEVTITNAAPVPDAIRVQTGAWTTEVTLEPGETRRVRIPRADAAIIPIAITTTAVFEFAPGQRVSCHVRLDLVSSS